MTDRNDENNVIIARQQQRRGLKQDLPQPLRPGELGFAVDSQQLFIGGDTHNPATADYNNASIFETTVNAREHTISIAENQIIAFTVPFTKYSQGEFFGVDEQWIPSAPRSSINATNRPECEHTSLTYPVFSPQITGSTTLEVVTATQGTPSANITVDLGNVSAIVDNFANMRVGDIASISTSSGSVVDATITNIIKSNIALEEFTLELDQAVDVDTGNVVTVKYNAVKNFLTGSQFTSSDVIVRKNGILLSGDPDSTSAPGAQYDYNFKTDAASNEGVHTLRLRSIPAASESVTLSYYSNTHVLAALAGNPVTGNISTSVALPGFYEEFDIPEYRQIPESMVRVSTTTGLGFIGLQNKHIQSVAEGAVVADTGNITVGNLLIARNDHVVSATTTTIDPLLTNRYVLDIGAAAASAYSTVDEDPAGVYRYNRIKLTRDPAVDADAYFFNTHFDVVDIDSGNVTIELPTKEFSFARECNVELASTARYLNNGYTNTSTVTVATIKGDTEGVKKDDWVRVVDSTGNANVTIHDTVFKAFAVREGQIDVRCDSAAFVADANTAPDFWANVDYSGLYFVNHGPDTVPGQPNVSTTIQAYAPNNELSTNPTQTTTEVGNVYVASVSTPYTISPTVPESIDSATPTANTFFFDGLATVGAGADMATATGTYYVDIADSYTDVDATPVLAINLGLANANTLSLAVTTINAKSVTTKVGTDDQQIFPQVNYVPDGEMNRLYLTQDPSYSSVGVGGLAFTLFEDRDTPTLSVFGFQPGEYTRENNTVKAKLEKWMNQLQQGRDINLFSTILKSGELYMPFDDLESDPLYYYESDPTNRFYGETIESKFGDYNLTIDDTYNELLFCERREAADFNFIVNSIYNESAFDRNQDSSFGAKGLLNVKTNIELQTRAQSGTGATTLNFPTTSEALILRSVSPDTTVASLPIGAYNSYIIEYTINSTGGSAVDTYTRVGSIILATNQELADANLVDNFATVTNKVAVPGEDVVEPDFYATVSGTTVELKMTGQKRETGNVSSDTVPHTIDADLLLRFTARRWNSLGD